MTFPEIVESKDLLWGRTCAVDNVRARRKGILGKLYEIQISPERGLRNSLKFPSYFGMEYVRPWNMGKKLLEFWLVGVLRATTACTFSASQLPKVVRTWCALYILTWKCASRHNGVQFFISHLACWLRTRRFSLLFDPPEPQIIGKTQWIATFLPFRAVINPPTLSLLSASSLLCFSSVHIVGSLTSKLPSTMFNDI